MEVMLYTIATKVSQVYGHGDSGDEWMIQRQGAYGTGEYPPVFPIKVLAEDYLEEMKREHFGEFKVVELATMNIASIETHC